MYFTIRLPDGGGVDDLDELWSWLTDEDDLRGRLTVIERPPDPGRLGPVADALVAALAPGGAVVVLVGAVLRWLRHTRGDLSVTVERDGDKVGVQVRAARVRGLDQAGVAALAREVTEILTKNGAAPDASAPPPDGVVSGRDD